MTAADYMVWFISVTECKLQGGWDNKIKGKTSRHVTYFILMAYSVHSLLLCRTRYVLFSRSTSSTSAWYLSIGPANLNHTWAAAALKTAVHDWREDVDAKTETLKWSSWTLSTQLLQVKLLPTTACVCNNFHYLPELWRVINRFWNLA